MYQIGWSDNGIDGLGELAVLHQGRWGDINSTCNLIEYRLQRYPMTFGREVSEGLWRIDVEPVSVTFTILDRDYRVHWLDRLIRITSSAERNPPPQGPAGTTPYAAVNASSRWPLTVRTRLRAPAMWSVM